MEDFHSKYQKQILLVNGANDNIINYIIDKIIIKNIP